MAKRGPKPKHTDAAKLQDMCITYFKEMEEQGRPSTVTGLALYLGYTSRQALLDNEKRDDQPQELVDAIKRAKLRVQLAYEERLHGNNPTGAIFALKNFGWKDRQDIEHSGPEGKPLVIRMVSTE